MVERSGYLASPWLKAARFGALTMSVTMAKAASSAFTVSGQPQWNRSQASASESARAGSSQTRVSKSNRVSATAPAALLRPFGAWGARSNRVMRPGLATHSITSRNTAWLSRTGSAKAGAMRLRSRVATLIGGLGCGPW